jgi:predicted nucleic acid-binding protein
MTVIPDTSPLILLAKIERLELLTLLYDEIVVPSAVYREVQAKSGSGAEGIHQWRRQYDIPSTKVDASQLARISADLGPGERSAIASACERNADLVILDDQEGRRVAQAHGVEVTGTVGVLVEARSAGHIDSFRDELDRLLEAGLWMSEAFYNRLLREFGES